MSDTPITPQEAKFLAHTDQAKVHLRDLLKSQQPAAVTAFIRKCAAGQFAQMTDTERLLAGALAATAAIDFLQMPFDLVFKD